MPSIHSLVARIRGLTIFLFVFFVPFVVIRFNLRSSVDSFYIQAAK